MPELTREEKLKLVEKLPQRLQDFLYSEDTGAVLLYFGKKYNLPDEKVSLLSKLVGDIVLGITPITSLAQEINSKIVPDPQASMHIAQELYAELLSPVMTEAKTAAPTVPTAPSTPTLPVVPASPALMPKPIPAQPTPKTDKYREPITLGPEIVDLRKTPPPQIPVPVSPAPIPPSPVIPVPLIEADPHLPAKISPEISADKIQEEKIPEPPAVSPSTSLRAGAVEPPKPPSPSQISPRETSSEDKPQFIIRPPGLAPTDAPRNILDLRRDKGEF